MRVRTLRTPRLTLEPQVAAHAEEMFRVLSDPAIYEYENEPPRSVEWLRARFARLESRRSPDGAEWWLNWVLQLPTSELVGYVQATVSRAGNASIAYELNSHYWGRGLATEAVGAMADELVSGYDVRTLSAVHKQRNLRSQRLLQRLGFAPAPAEHRLRAQLEPDEQLMLRAARSCAPGAS